MEPVVAGITITHPERRLFPAAGLTKLDLARYYDAVADRMLPHLVGRPLTLKQCAPDADHCRYLRHSGERAPKQVRVVNIREKTKIGDYMIVDDRDGLIALAQRNIVELHTWNSIIDRVERPDRLVFDLDPGPAVAWRALVVAARLMRQTLRDIGLESWLKTTGGRGLHVVVPIVPAHDWSVCLEFARQVSTAIASHDPSRYTVKFAKRGRESLILIDYLRNNRTNTSVAAYSVRARSAATVSMPLAWEELSPRLDPARWTIITAPRRVARAADPWADYFRARQRLPVHPAGSTRRRARGGT
jgi:bifunctional non-homologous end joining protein LigD